MSLTMPWTTKIAALLVLSVKEPILIWSLAHFIAVVCGGWVFLIYSFLSSWFAGKLIDVQVKSSLSSIAGV